jgi:hypothetical protein
MERDEDPSQKNSTACVSGSSASSNPKRQALPTASHERLTCKPHQMKKYCSLYLAFVFLSVPALAADTAAWPPRDDPSARTWLPVEELTATTAIDGFLNSLTGHMRILGCWYEGNQLRATRAFADGKLVAGKTSWNSETTFDHRSSQSDSLDISLTFKLISGLAHSFGVAVAFDFTDWSIDNYILAPAQIYGGNRFRIYDTGYPPYIQDEQDRPLDMPITVTNILHLSRDGSPAKIEMNTGNLATPMLSFFNAKARRGFILLAEQRTRFGNNGLFIQEDAEPSAVVKRASFVVSAPGVRKQRYKMSGREATSDRGADWNLGDELTLKFKIYNFECVDMECFYAKVFDVRKALLGKNSYSNVTPYSAAAGFILEHHNTNKWFETSRVAYYNYKPGSPLGYHNQVGWSGVPIYSFPNMIAETPQRLRRVSLSMDSIVVGMQGRTGLYYAMSDGRGQIVGDTHATMVQRPTISMIRRSMDVLYFGIRTIELMVQRGHSGLINSEWETALRATADGLVKVWNDYGQFGQFIDVKTGKMDTNGSTAGVAAGSALALASRHFNEPKYLEVAEAATKMYYERDFLKGYAGGGAADILQSPDSETPYDMLESCIALYEITGKKEWLDRAKFATHVLVTWMVSYDYQFPKGSVMERAGTRAAGSIFASSQNNHSAPGYYIHSGDGLLKLFRATGDQRYAEMYKDQSHNVIQYAGAPNNPLRTQKGYVTERVQLSDWEGDNSIGDVNYDFSDTSWEVLVALTCLENPGIYLHTDDDTLLVMDHIEAEVVEASRQRATKTLRIKNPTVYDAVVSIFAETAKVAKTSLGWGAYDKWPKIKVKAGATKIVRIGRHGMIEPFPLSKKPRNSARLYRSSSRPQGWRQQKEGVELDKGRR